LISFLFLLRVKKKKKRAIQRKVRAKNDETGKQQATTHNINKKKS
jgi:hypothetical protein